MIRVLIVHEHQLIGSAMTTALQAELGIEVVGYAAALEPTLTYLVQESCDIIVTSAMLPRNAILHIVDFLSSNAATAKVLVTDMPNVQSMILHYLEAGVAGYVHEDESLANLIEKILAVHKNEFPLLPAIASGLIARLSQLKKLVPAELANQNLERTRALPSLTQREHDVMRLLLRGCTNQAIADTLVIEVGTAKNHVHTLFRKLGLRRREDVAFFAKQFVEEWQPQALY